MLTVVRRMVGLGIESKGLAIMTNLINEAADMIAAFDRNAANVFRNQPFRRTAIATAFRNGFRKHSENSLATCDLLDKVAALDIKMRTAQC